MRHVSRCLLAVIVVAVVLLAPRGALAAAKKYQVTGTVTAVTGDTVTIVKADGDKWELNRDPKMAAKEQLKVGQKVTIQYSMTIATVDVKAGK